MADTNSYSSWYMSKYEKERKDGADATFREVLAAFSSELSKDEGKLKWIMDSGHTNIDSVLRSVIEARVAYEARKEDSKASKVRKALVELSEKVYHYSGVMDVLVSHHPEYTALVYGAMKFLFVGVVNHQKLLSQLCAGLSSIATILPRAELIMRLYPTQQVKDVIVALNANILKFLLRALRWYQENKITHMLHAFTRPAELRYNDLLASISSLSGSMTELALASSHAEQRDMHTSINQQICEQKRVQTSIDGLMAAVSELRGMIVSEQAINASSRIEIRETLSEIQLAQFIAQLSVVALPDPMKALDASLFMSKKHRLKRSHNGPAFWLDAKMQRWNLSEASSLIIVNGTRDMRFHLQHFCAASIAVLRNTKLPVIWGLRNLVSGNTNADQVSTVDLIKYLIIQAVGVNENMHTNAASGPRLGACLGAKTEEDWLRVLASVLYGIPLLYIILDIEVLSQPMESIKKDFWPSACFKIFAELSDRGINTIIRVALVSYGSKILKGDFSKKHQDLVLTVGGMRQVRASAARVSQHVRPSLPARKEKALDLKAINSGQQSSKRLERSSRQPRRR